MSYSSGEDLVVRVEDPDVSPLLKKASSEVWCFIIQAHLMSVLDSIYTPCMFS